LKAMSFSMFSSERPFAIVIASLSKPPICKAVTTVCVSDSTGFVSCQVWRAICIHCEREGCFR
jgi:hypothetical protein